MNYIKVITKHQISVAIFVGTVIASLLVWMISKGGKNNLIHIGEDVYSMSHASHPSKCYACEKQSSVAYPTKCFDCERQQSQAHWQVSYGSPRLFAGLAQ